MSARDPFAVLAAALEAAGIRYAIGGSWASLAYCEARSTNDIDLVADLDLARLEALLSQLPPDFYADADEARSALARGRPFNIIHMPSVMKFDIFPARAYPLGTEELERAVLIANAGLAERPLPYVSAEDILLAKLSWYRQGGETSERQWRDIMGIVEKRRSGLDRAYLEGGAARLGVTDLLERALSRGGM